MLAGAAGCWVHATAAMLSVTLASGRVMPMLGLGVYKSAEKTYEAVMHALRHWGRGPGHAASRSATLRLYGRFVPAGVGIAILTQRQGYSRARSNCESPSRPQRVPARESPRLPAAPFDSTRMRRRSVVPLSTLAFLAKSYSSQLRFGDAATVVPSGIPCRHGQRVSRATVCLWMDRRWHRSTAVMSTHTLKP